MILMRLKNLSFYEITHPIYPYLICHEYMQPISPKSQKKNKCELFVIQRLAEVGHVACLEFFLNAIDVNFFAGRYHVLLIINIRCISLIVQPKSRIAHFVENDHDEQNWFLCFISWLTGLQSNSDALTEAGICCELD